MGDNTYCSNAKLGTSFQERINIFCPLDIVHGLKGKCILQLQATQGDWVLTFPSMMDEIVWGNKRFTS